MPLPRLTLAALRVELARAQQRAESAERVLETVLRAAFPPGVPAPASSPPPVAVPAAEPPAPELPAITDRVLAVCRKFGPDDRQYALNLQRARTLAQQGKKEEEIVRAIYYGERGPE